MDRAIAHAQSQVEINLLKKYPASYVGILNYFKEMRSRWIMIQQNRDACKAHIAKRDIIKKCLAILIDNKLMEFTVYKNLIVRRSSNDSVHLTLEDNLVVIDALRNSASELAQSADISRSDKELLLELASHSSKLANLLYTDGKNFDKQPFSLEAMLDSRSKEDTANFVQGVKEKIAKDASKPVTEVQKKGLSDLIILMKWFDNRSSATHG